MAQASTLYRFKIDLSDIERSVYESFDVRLAMHPSETEYFLLTRLLAYALNYEEGIQFSDGLSAPDDPSISVSGVHGQILKWIDIGHPSARRLHKASKAARKVRVYTYKNPENLKKEVAGEQIHRVGEIEVFAFDISFLAQLASALRRDNSWVMIHTEGEIVITVGDESFVGAVSSHRLGA
jgi:uncharacterized protein YaeQ